MEKVKISIDSTISDDFLKSFDKSSDYDMSALKERIYAYLITGAQLSNLQDIECIEYAADIDKSKYYFLLESHKLMRDILFEFAKNCEIKIEYNTKD